MSRENYCLRLTTVGTNEPIYVMVSNILAFTQVTGEAKDGKSFGRILMQGGGKIDVVEVPQQILQIARTTGIINAIPN